MTDWEVEWCAPITQNRISGSLIDRQTDRQTDRQQTDRQTDRQIEDRQFRSSSREARMSKNRTKEKAIWLTGYQSFGVHGLQGFPTVADYPTDLKKRIVEDALSDKFAVLRQVRELRMAGRARDMSARRIQRAFRSRPKGVDHVINNKTALGIRP